MALSSFQGGLSKFQVGLSFPVGFIRFPGGFIKFPVLLLSSSDRRCLMHPGLYKMLIKISSLCTIPISQPRQVTACQIPKNFHLPLAEHGKEAEKSAKVTQMGWSKVWRPGKPINLRGDFTSRRSSPVLGKCLKSSAPPQAGRKEWNLLIEAVSRCLLGINELSWCLLWSWTQEEQRFHWHKSQSSLCQEQLLPVWENRSCSSSPSLPEAAIKHSQG